MTNIAEALRSFYSRDESKIVFRGNLTLSQAALRISEQLGFTSFDAAALSRVVNGERLFTAAQLQAFGAVLHLSRKEQDWLTVCLQADYVARVGLPKGAFFLSIVDTVGLLEHLFASAQSLRMDGEQTHYLHLTATIQQLLDRLAHRNLSEAQEQQIGVYRGWALYLEARGLVRAATPERALPAAQAHVRQLHQLRQQYPLPAITAYLQALLSQVFYVQGGYALPEYKPFFFRAAIASARKAVDLLPGNDPERLLVLSIIAASAAYLNDHDPLIFVEQIAAEILPQSPQENRAPFLLLGNLLAKGAALRGDRDPFALRDRVAAYFPGGLGRGYFALSDTKTQLETLLVLHTNDTAARNDLLSNGMRLAQEGNYARHIAYFQHLEATLPEPSR